MAWTRALQRKSLTSGAIDYHAVPGQSGPPKGSQKGQVRINVKEKGGPRAKPVDKESAGVIVLAMGSVVSPTRLHALGTAKTVRNAHTLTLRTTSSKGPSATRVMATALQGKVKGVRAEGDGNRLGEEAAKAKVK